MTDPKALDADDVEAVAVALLHADRTLGICNIANNDSDKPMPCMDGCSCVQYIADKLSKPALSCLQQRGWGRNAWRSDMENAPRDGTRIDLWFAIGGRVADCYWSVRAHLDKSAWSKDRVIIALDDAKWKQPTHWQPLPPPPETKT